MNESRTGWFAAHRRALCIAAAAVLLLAAVAAAVVFAVRGKGEETAANPSKTAVPASTAVPTSAETTAAPQTDPAPTTRKAVTQAQTQPAAAEETAAKRTDGDKTVYYPQSLSVTAKQYPVIVWANGTGCATATYDGLLTRFAEAGYVVVADSSVMTADGTAQRDSIDYILAEASEQGSPFYGNIDTAKVGAAGHSQGGRSAVVAANADRRITCVLSIAGSNFPSEAEGLRTPVFFMTGTADAVVASAMWVKPAYDAVDGTAVYASLKGGVHTTCMTSPDKIAGYAVDWFDAYLKGDRTKAAVFAASGALARDDDWQDFARKG